MKNLLEKNLHPKELFLLHTFLNSLFKMDSKEESKMDTEEESPRRKAARALYEAFDFKKLSPRQVEIIEQYIDDTEDEVSDYTTDFVYADHDTYHTEMSELYSYSEEPEFKKNVRAFEDLVTDFEYPPSWAMLQDDKKKQVVMQTLDLLESQDEDVRNRASRCLLYLVQGCWADLLLESQHEEAVKENVMLIYKLGGFSSCVDLLRFELLNFKREYSYTIVDSEAVRVVCSVLYTIIEVFRKEKDLGDESCYQDEVQELCSEILSPIKGEYLLTTLFRTIHKYVKTPGAYLLYSMRKIILLIWKIVLITLGGLDEARKLKIEKRVELGLPPQHDEIDAMNRKYDSEFKKLYFKPKARFEDYMVLVDKLRVKCIGYSLLGDSQTTAGLPEMSQECLESFKNHIYTPLAQSQIEKEESLLKYPLSNQSSSEIKMNPTDMIYQAMLPDFKQYAFGLCRLLFFSFPSRRRNKVEVNPLMLDLVRAPPPEPPKKLSDIFTLNMDMFRHEEVILKATSAVVLLLLKHFRVNHVYQFEHLAQCLVFNDIIRIFHDFCEQNLASYLRTINEVYLLNFPTFLIGYQPELSLECLGIADRFSFSWRTMFLCVNFLRIMNKVAKWKNGRVMALVSLENHKRLLKFTHIKNRIFRYYALKLSKLQMSHAGKLWRKDVPFCITEIFYNVRLHVNERFLTDSRMEYVSKRRLLRRVEERRLSLILDDYNDKKLEPTAVESEEIEDHRKALAKECHLSEVFKKNYEKWLALEVFNEADDCDIFFY